jgi:zinc protease
VLHRFALLLGFTFLALLAHAEAPSWPHALSDLRPDPSVRWGRLPNGVRYAVGANTEATARASLRLVVLAGTVHETDRQRGYAHFVEHLAFLGTRRYPGQTLHAALQRQGIARGPDVNAYTHPDRTVYRLDLPSAEPDRLRRSLEVLREFADGITFDAAEVDRESRVILIERALRTTPTERSEAALRRFLFAASPLAETNGFGSEDSVRRATASTLREFYDTWYRADNLVVVAVGAFDPATVVQEIEAQFGSLPTPAAPRPAIAFSPIGNPPTLRVGIERATAGANAVRLTLVSLAPAPAVDTQAGIGELLRRTIAFDALNRRLDRIPHESAGRVVSAVASLNTGPFYRQATLRVDCSREHWKRGLQTLEQELRRVLEHGFTPAEIAESRAKVAALVDYSAKAESTRLSEAQADAMVESIAENRVFVASADFAELSSAALANVTPVNCLAAFRDVWGPGQPQLFVSGDFGRTRVAEEIATAYQRSAGKRLKPPAPPSPVAFAYGDFGPPGEIVAREHIADLDLHCIRFANGVLLNLKPTRFEANRVVYGAKLGNGTAGEPRTLPGVRYFADAGLGLLGLGRHDDKELGRLAAGHLASLSITTGEDAFYLSGLSNTDGAERVLQLLTAHLTDPGWRNDTLLRIRQRMLSRLEETTTNATSYLTSLRQAKLARDDSRYALPAASQLARYSLADFRSWMEPQLESAPLEIGIVGDFDVEEMIRLASRTLGCLPRRSHQSPARPVMFEATVPPVAIATPATTLHGVIQLTWSVPAPATVRTEHQLELLAEVLRNRLIARIRGELGATYSANCQIWRSEVRRDIAYVVASLNCAPDDVGSVATVAKDIADQLARDGVTDEEFERARQPRLQTAPAQLRTNGYWLSATVATAQTRPDQLEWPRQRVALLEQITAAELSALAAEVLPAPRASLFTAAPTK